MVITARVKPASECFQTAHGQRQPLGRDGVGVRCAI